MRKLSFAPLVAIAVSCGGTSTQEEVAFDAGHDTRPDVVYVDTAVEETPDPGGAPYPVILAHGMGGFGTLKAGSVDLLTYFNGVKADLAAHGETQVYTTLVAPYDTSENRAKQLATQIDQILAATGKRKVNLIGHSQGGMDLRVLASPAGLGYGSKIASVTTIATPHRGSQVADVTAQLIDPSNGFSFNDIANALLGILERAVYEVNSDPNLGAQVKELSEHYMVTTFNPKYVDDPTVPYFSYAGRTIDATGSPDCDNALYANDPSKLDDGQALLVPIAQFLTAKLQKANDGLVTVQSAKWGAFLGCVPADHMSEVGQIDITTPNPKSGFDHLAFFRLVVSRLRDRGF